MSNRWSLMRMGWRKRVLPAAAGMLVLVIMLTVHFFKPFALERFGNQLFDQYQRMQPREYRDVGVRVVDLDEESIDRIGQWPWPRTQIAQMTERMFNLGFPVEFEGETYLAPAVGAVAYDVVFSEPDRTSPENLRSTLMSGGASDEVLSALETYTPHDQVFSNLLRELTSNYQAVMMGYFFERIEGDDTSPRYRHGIVEEGTTPVSELPHFFSVTDSIPLLNDAAFDAGFISSEPDADGIFRTASMLAFLDLGQAPDDPFLLLDVYTSLSLSMYRFYLEVTATTDAELRASKGYKVVTSTGSGEAGADVSQITGIRFGERFIPTTKSGELLLHYTEPGQMKVVPAWKLLDPNVSDQELIDAFVLQEGENAGQPAMVFVGASAQGLRDLRATPVDPLMPGVHVHAQALEQMMLGHFLSKPDWGPGLRFAVMLLGGIILILIIPISGPLRGGLVALVLLGGLFFGSWNIFSAQRMLFDPVYPAVALSLVYLVTSTVTFVMTEAEKSYINGAFSRYLSPDMVAQIADDPEALELGGENRDMTILFSDIRSFTRISEGMSPAELTGFLNRYLTPMTQILMSNRATVDKYIGDAIMAFWNAPLDDPDHHKNAARSALAMLDKLHDLNVNRTNASVPDTDKLPVETSIGIGLYSGSCSVGNMGSDQRFDYSVLGDVVNTSSRLEGMTKQYGVAILLGDETARHLDGFALVEVDRAQAVGKEHWLAIYSLVGDEQVAMDPDFAHLQGLHEEFLAAYRAQRFDEALTLIGALSPTSEGFGLGKYYGIMKERIEAYLVDPPPKDWDGVYVLRQK